MKRLSRCSALFAIIAYKRHRIYGWQSSETIKYLNRLETSSASTSSSSFPPGSDALCATRKRTFLCSLPIHHWICIKNSSSSRAEIYFGKSRNESNYSSRVSRSSSSRERSMRNIPRFPLCRFRLKRRELSDPEDYMTMRLKRNSANMMLRSWHQSQSREVSHLSNFNCCWFDSHSRRTTFSLATYCKWLRIVVTQPGWWTAEVFPTGRAEAALHHDVMNCRAQHVSSGVSTIALKDHQKLQPFKRTVMSVEWMKLWSQHRPERALVFWER